jgi:hypothetical protein
MVTVYSGAAVLLAGAASLTLTRHLTTKDQTIEQLLPKLRRLPPESQKSLQNVEGLMETIGTMDVHLSLGDAYRVLFFNSRCYLKISHRLWAADRENSELKVLFECMKEDHRKLRWFLFLNIIEAIIDRLGLVSTRPYSNVLLLDTYGRELEVLSQISEECSFRERAALKEVL